MSERVSTGTLFETMCDDAAVFPPGNLPLAVAVEAHARHRRAAYARYVGPLILAPKDLASLAPLIAPLPQGSLDVAVTTTVREVGGALEAVAALSALRLTAIEVALAEDAVAADAVSRLDEALAGQEVEFRGAVGDVIEKALTEAGLAELVKRPAAPPTSLSDRIRGDVSGPAPQLSVRRLAITMPAPAKLGQDTAGVQAAG